MRDTRSEAFRVMARAFAILALVLCFSPVLAEDFVPPGQLERVVILSRHGVRSPTHDGAALQSFRKPTTPPWPDFGVQHPADLTLKGASLMQRMGYYYRERWRTALFKDACPNWAFFWADRDERTLMTARALVGGLAGGACDLRVQEMIAPRLPLGPTDTEATDPIFHPTRALPACKPPAAENPPVSKEYVGLVQEVVQCCSEKPGPGNLCQKMDPPRTSCDLQNLLDDKNTQDQAYDFIQSFGEILLFEYAQEYKGDHFAFGNPQYPPVENGKWTNLLKIHAYLFNQRQRNRSVALPQGANLLYHMAYAIKNGAPLIPPSTVGAPSKFVVYVGHDTNIANVAGLLGLEWKIYSENDVAPGAALAFEVRRYESREYVYPVMLAQSPESLRGDGSDVSSEWLHVKAPPPIAGCTGPNGSCEMGEFVKIVIKAIEHDKNKACITDWKDLAD
jgi:4-phytase/acid phosphatase